MWRRQLLGLVGGAIALPLAARAQQPERMRRIGVLMGFPQADTLAQSYVAAMRQKLVGLGWVENRNIQFVYRWGGGDPEKTRAFAKELVGMLPNVIVTSTNQATETMRQETQTIPIVFASLGDPVGSGLVESMNRPGGNVTGFPAFVETMGGKWLELMKEVAPRATRIGFIHHPGVAPHRGLLRAAQAAATPLKIDLVPLPIHNADEITVAITAFASGGYGGLVIGSHAVTYSNRDLLIRLAAQHRLPSLFGDPLFAESGALMSYGSDQAEMFLGAASYVDQILKGSNPAEMPVQLPTKFNFIINLKTAEAIGLTIPPAMLARADRVIE
jgi:putative tryptophan/tyrosine transport system substrate-binding protein